MLLDYFALNERDSNAHQFTYSEIPSHYVFKKQTGSNVSKWEKRKSHFNVIGRMYSVSPTQSELFHLRLLLITATGPTSFENLRTVDGHTHPTFQSTCLALGLIEDDAEWDRAMTEGEVWMMPRQLRHFFVRILIDCQPINSEEFWENFKEAMSQDFQRHLSTGEADRRAYVGVNRLLSYEGSDISRFPNMPPLTVSEENYDAETDDEISLEQYKDIGRNQYGKLNSKQKDIVDNVLNVVDSTETPTPYFYIDGPGGSGKTFIYATLYYLLRAKRKKVHTVAFTGIAAILLPRGKTVHKSFGMPVPIFNDSVSSFKNQSTKAQYLREIDVFIWDEAPMAPRYALELVDRSLRDFMGNDLPFGGKIMILGGDFRQLLPVKPNATRSELVDLSIKFSSLWRHFSIFALTQNMRALPQEMKFAKYLLSVGDGSLNDDNNNIEAPEQCVAHMSADTIDIFRNIISERRYGDLAKVAILSARTVDVGEINNRVIDLLDRRIRRIYASIDSVENCDNGDIITSPTGLIDDDGVVEIFFLHAARDRTPVDAIENGIAELHKIYQDHDITQMNPKHNWYYHIQGGFHHESI
ncbi:ATP-dependent DNA helicase PIF2-like [Diachasma alloeum]|uniref:ATP-dependent DNA helicase PIF2-like n=1 Tax=Diachasma alloeum TaxID=454923 RepID=UPI000738226D|nr:ATP-dependent DNA helicase PIF2-like [Diachasma alloeum]